jgi:hypothetical protein
VKKITNKPIVLLINGKARSGKDTVAKMLRDEVELGLNNIVGNVAIIGFADALKSTCSRNFGYKGKEENREVLLEVGDRMREVNLDVFSNIVKELVKTYALLGYKLIVIPDFRYENEYTTLKRDLDAHVFSLRLHRELPSSPLSEFSKAHKSENGTFDVDYEIHVPDFRNEFAIGDFVMELRSMVDTFAKEALRLEQGRK